LQKRHFFQTIKNLKRAFLERKKIATTFFEKKKISETQKNLGWLLLT